MDISRDFTKSLPKVELHAHLTGSITRECLHNIWLARSKEHLNQTLEDPLEVLKADKCHYDVVSFFPLFTSYIYKLVDTLPSLVYSTNAVLDDFTADGVCYLELRTTPRVSPYFTKEQYIKTILDCISDHNKNQDDLHTYLILSIDRRNTAAEMASTIDLAVKYRDQGIVGVDLCGNPSHPIDIEMLHREFSRAKRAGLKLTLHFAETTQSASRAELEGLIAMDPDRLGHVIHVPEDIKDVIVARSIGLELCLSCNVLAKLTTGGFEEHHFREWYRRMGKVVVVLCTDDFGVFMSPLSLEYYLAAKCFDLKAEDLLDMCESACAVIFGDQDEKSRIKEKIALHRINRDFSN
ncbi:MAG: hypothetical protein L6R38_001242 [Xanthoria sp. 2 TBL-2021]|nr:MAG: hypothetical protein L6R38_001242 [Xanthoria sp. 2 TBL-2021]